MNVYKGSCVYVKTSLVASQMGEVTSKVFSLLLKSLAIYVTVIIFFQRNMQQIVLYYIVPAAKCNPE